MSGGDEEGEENLLTFMTLHPNGLYPGPGSSLALSAMDSYGSSPRIILIEGDDWNIPEPSHE